MKVPKLKYAVGSVAQAAVEGADSLLSEARKDVVAARSPEPAMPKEVEEMAMAVSKVQGSAESEAPAIAAENLKETTKLVNSFNFQGGNKKMDKAYIMESLGTVIDSPIVESSNLLLSLLLTFIAHKLTKSLSLSCLKMILKSLITLQVQKSV